MKSILLGWAKFHTCRVDAFFSAIFFSTSLWWLNLYVSLKHRATSRPNLKPSDSLWLAPVPLSLVECKRVCFISVLNITGFICGQSKARRITDFLPDAWPSGQRPSSRCGEKVMNESMIVDFLCAVRDVYLAGRQLSWRCTALPHHHNEIEFRFVCLISYGTIIIDFLSHIKWSECSLKWNILMRGSWQELCLRW